MFLFYVKKTPISYANNVASITVQVVGIIDSNHGASQLDYSPTTSLVLKEVLDPNHFWNFLY